MLARLDCVTHGLSVYVSCDAALDGADLSRRAEARVGIQQECGPVGRYNSRPLSSMSGVALNATVVIDDDHGQSQGAPRSQTAFALERQGRGEALPAYVRVNSKPVEAASPPIPGGDQRPYQRSSDLGDEQRLLTSREQAPQALAGDARKGYRRHPNSQPTPARCPVRWHFGLSTQAQSGQTPRVLGMGT
jgi:hypothetical protein